MALPTQSGARNARRKHQRLPGGGQLLGRPNEPLYIRLPGDRETDPFFGLTRWKLRSLIDPITAITLKTGDELVGWLTSESDKKVVLRPCSGEPRHIPKTDIARRERRKPLVRSIALPNHANNERKVRLVDFASLKSYIDSHAVGEADAP